MNNYPIISWNNKIVYKTYEKMTPILTGFNLSKQFS